LIVGETVYRRQAQSCGLGQRIRAHFSLAEKRSEVEPHHAPQNTPYSPCRLLLTSII
jgi:hypothetical protein